MSHSHLEDIVCTQARIHSFPSSSWTPTLCKSVYTIVNTTSCWCHSPRICLTKRDFPVLSVFPLASYKLQAHCQSTYYGKLEIKQMIKDLKHLNFYLQLIERSFHWSSSTPKQRALDEDGIVEVLSKKKRTTKLQLN